jgi:hypothetical protein
MNMGMKKICVHINVNTFHPKAIIYDFNQVHSSMHDDEGGTTIHNHSDHQEDMDEIFMGFVNYNEFKDIGLD